MRQFAIEGLLLAVVSGAAALVVAGWSADLLSAFSLPSPIPQRLHIVVDRRLIGFTVVLVAFAGIVPTLLPALQATRVNLVATMRMETALGPRRSRMRNVFTIAQIAGSTLFLTAALLFLRSFWTQASTSPGFDIEHLLVLELKPSDFDYDAARYRVLFDNLVERIRALPGVERVALGDRIPFYVGFPKVTKALGRRNRLRDSRVPGRLRLRRRYRLHGGARRTDGVWPGLQRTGHLSGRRRLSSARSWRRASGRAARRSANGSAKEPPAASSA